MSSIIDGKWVDNGANGGTQLMVRRLLSSNVDLDGVQIHVSRLDERIPGKKQVLYLHDLSNDPMVDHLHHTSMEWDAIVFVSHWQRQQFHNVFSLNDNKTHVIQNAIEPLELKANKEGPLKFIYCSMPNRGLDLVVSTFDLLSKKFDVELDVYSSFKLYNQDRSDAYFSELFSIIDKHPKMNNHGTVSNTNLRSAMSNADVFVHPGTNRPETSCLCLIEAMSAGLWCIHSSFGALPETAKGLTMMYDSTIDVQSHANRLYRSMYNTCSIYEAHGRRSLLNEFGKILVDNKHSLTTFSQSWNNLLKSL